LVFPSLYRSAGFLPKHFFPKICLSHTDTYRDHYYNEQISFIMSAEDGVQLSKPIDAAKVDVELGEPEGNDGVRPHRALSNSSGGSSQNGGAIVTRIMRAPSFYPVSLGGMGPESNGEFIHRSPEDGESRKERVVSISAEVPHNAPAVLVWKDLTVSTRTNPPKVLLDGISGQITGGFWAIMGGSGSGKTTLLSTISLRIDTSKMSRVGDLHLNGLSYDSGILKAMSAYVMQDDLLHAELTVRETVKYAADLRLAGQMDEEARKQRQIDVLNLMGISHVADVIIGDTTRKGISGGERKRVCVAIELLTGPKLLFLDEPTSGLDSQTALGK